jgi:hypothetical protein
VKKLSIGIRRGKRGSEKLSIGTPPRRKKWGRKKFSFPSLFPFFPHDGPHVKRFWTVLVTYNRRGDRESFEGFLNPLLYKKK